MPGLRILITNFMLINRTGTELYVRDLALGLQRAGHQPMVYSPSLGGDVAAALARAGVPATDRLDREMATPDVLHCHHRDPALAALSRFPNRPGIAVQHDAEAPQDEPLRHPRVLRHLAVDEVCRERLLSVGIDPELTSIVPNGVDLRRFARRPPLPKRPRRALVFSNSAGEENYLPTLRAACRQLGIDLDVAGLGVGAVMTHPERELAGYDVVFAKGRAAAEAIAVGCAVIVADVVGLGGMVTFDLLPQWRRHNLGRRLLTGDYQVDRVAAEMSATTRPMPNSARGRSAAAEVWTPWLTR